MEQNIEVKNLNVEYIISQSEKVHALREINLQIKKGESIAIVGESGCGKTTLANAFINLLPQNANIKGEVLIEGSNIISKTNKELESIRGKIIATIFQEAASALNPVFTVKQQIEETLLAHNKGMSKPGLEAAGEKLLQEAGISDVKRVYNSYPHQLSGGQQQRAMISIALSCNPEILVADEPTTALDVTVQAQIMQTLKKLKKERQLTLILITHDLHLAIETAERVIVMYAGEVMEDCSIKNEKDAFHPYTRALFELIPDLNEDKKEFMVIKGEVPDLKEVYDRCYFYGRCEYGKDKCAQKHPEIEEISKAHYLRCYFPVRK